MHLSRAIGRLLMVNLNVYISPAMAYDKQNQSSSYQSETVKVHVSFNCGLAQQFDQRARKYLTVVYSGRAQCFLAVILRLDSDRRLGQRYH